MGQVTVTKVVEGNAQLTIRVDLLSDGVSGELIDYPIITPSMMNPPFPNNGPTFRIMQLWYGMVWFDATFTCGGVPTTPLWTLARDCDSHVDFRSFGGIVDVGAYASPPAADTGILLLTTNGFAPAGSRGTIIMELRKLTRTS